MYNPYYYFYIHHNILAYNLYQDIHSSYLCIFRLQNIQIQFIVKSKKEFYNIFNFHSGSGEMYNKSFMILNGNCLRCFLPYKIMTKLLLSRYHGGIVLRITDHTHPVQLKSYKMYCTVHFMPTFIQYTIYNFTHCLGHQ